MADVIDRTGLPAPFLPMQHANRTVWRLPAGPFAGGLRVPVWGLVPGASAAEGEEPATAFAARLDAALAETGELDEPTRRARAGLANRQVTLR